MKNKKKAPKRFSPGPVLVLALAACAVGVGIWSMLAPAASAPGVSAEPGSPDSAPGQWVVLESRERGFRVSLPVQARELPVAAGEEGGVDTTWVATYAGGTIQVRVSDCPKVLCQKVPGSILDGARKGSLEALGGTLLSEKRLEVRCPQGTCPGLEFEATGPQGLRVSARYVISGEKVFGLIGTGSNETFGKIVESFSFL